MQADPHRDPRQEAVLHIPTALKRLREHADIALASAHDQKREIHGSINWGDLHVIHTAYVEYDDEQHTWQVLIEEADPINPDLHAFLHDHIRGQGWHRPLQVHTEW